MDKIPLVSIIIPSRNEIFLTKTIQDVLTKAKGEIEVITVLDGYWPVDIKREYWSTPAVIDDPKVIYLHHGKPLGLRKSVSAAVSIARGKFILKCDAHCMFGEGYDLILAKDCQSDWVAIPRRYSLDAEKWERKNKTPIDYLYIDCPTAAGARDDLAGREWRERNGNPEFEKKEIDDLMTFQGSCWFMAKDYFKKLELFDERHYGTFRKEPQEISFKCWLSGGRVIRNKKTWYAHLHKGKQYSRGYRLTSSDWEKGDQFNKKWLTNSAWRGQTKDFKWLIEKFNPPGWDKYDWSNYQTLAKTQPEIIQPKHTPNPPSVSVKEDKKPDKPTAENNITTKKVKDPAITEEKKPRLYQNIGNEEGDFLWQNPKKKNSKFWNEGKWNNFIAPLLPKDCTDMTFVEVGCNAGLFLKLAYERGFRKIVGVDSDKNAIREGLRYRDTLGYDYQMLHRQVGRNFNFDELPVADVLLLSTVHYYFDLQDWIEFLEKLQNKARLCLIVSRSVDPDQHWVPSGELADLKNYFKHWQENSAISDVPTRHDPSPRNLWSIVFESDLISMNIDKIYIKNERHRTWIDDYKKMNAAKIKLAEEIAENDSVKMESTDYFKRWAKRKEKSWPEEKIRKFVQQKIDLMYDVKNNGLKKPLIVKSWGQICEGGHRLAILRALGYKKVIVRTV